MKNIEKLKITKDSTIKQALKVISKGGVKIAIIVDKKNKLLGTLTDGDIRRGFLKGLDLNSSIKSIITKKPIITKKIDIKKKTFRDALLKKIYQIPIVDNNHKFIGIHLLDKLIKVKKKNNKVIIMAGGRGTRLRPLTKNIPKPMLKIRNKPILQTIVEKFKLSGYTNFTICVNYKSKVIKNYFGNGKKFGVKIDYIHEKRRMGTAGALSLLKNKPKESFFVINGDLLTNFDFEKLLDFHLDNKSRATMCVTEYIINSPYGEVRLDDINIVSIKEKPKHKFFVNAGIYVLDPKCIKLIPKIFFDMTSLFKKIISSKYKTISFPITESWLDVGRMGDFRKANEEYNVKFQK
jgi:dTDP-glucose pyrophosphorylase